MPNFLKRLEAMHVLYVLTTLFFCVTPLAAEETKPVEDLPQLITTALANNPELKASEARWQMFSNRIAQERSFADPMLMLKLQNGVVNEPFNFSKDPMTQKMVEISQRIPFWGKRGLKGERAAKQAESFRWRLDERKVELVRMVKEVWYRIFYVDKSLDIVTENIEIMNDFIKLAETKYTVGKGAQQDVLKAQVGRSKLFDAQITLKQRRRSLTANLNTLLYRPADTPVGKIADFEIRPLSFSDDELQQVSEENRPLIKSYKALIGKGEAGYQLAQKEFYPDFNVSLAYMQRDPVGNGEGNDMYSLGLTFNLPLQRERLHAAVAESESETRMATEELNTFRNSIRYGIADLLAELDRRRELVELYKTALLPQAEQSLESSIIGYQVNKVDFLTLLDSQVTLLNYQREYYDSLADYQVQLARLEAQVGKELQ